MTTCRQCGVLVEDGLDECPLCGEPVSEERRQQRKSEDERDNVLMPGAQVDADNEQTVRSAKIWLFEMVSLVAFTAGIIIFAADFASDFTLTWSVYPLLAIGFVYLFTSAIIGFVRRPVLLLVAETALVSGFLLLLSLLVGSGSWFLTIALPVTVLVAILIGVSALSIVRFRLNALQTLAVIFLASGFFVVGLEVVISSAIGEGIVVSWSLIAFACTLSLFFLILFINRRLRERHADFKKIFHI